MASLRELVSGQGCSGSSGGRGGNPLATLVDTLFLKGQEKLPNQGLTIPSGVPSCSAQVAKIRNRAGIVTRHMFPGAEQPKPVRSTVMLPNVHSWFSL